MSRLLFFLFFWAIKSIVSVEHLCSGRDELPFMKLTNNSLHMIDYIVYTDRPGNYLTLYYNARGIAKLLDLCFVQEPLVQLNENAVDWFEYFPTEYCPPKSKQEEKSLISFNGKMSTKEEIFNELCRTFDGYAWAYPHIKPGAWLVARPEMQIEVKNALTEHAKHESLPLPITRNKNNATVIYLRCKANDTVLTHEAYGPVGFSHYKSAADSENIIIISVAKHGICVEIRTELVNYLTKLNNKVNIKIQTESVYDDYIQLVYAPRLFCDVSTFCLTAGLASQGTVYMPKLWETHMVFAIDRFVWSTESPVLLPHMKKSLGIECEEGCPHFSEHDKFIVKKWLWEH